MKTSLKISAAILFATTLFLNVSFDSSGNFSLFSKAKAEEKPTTWKTYQGVCPNGTKIIVCGSGSDASCTPSGSC